MSDFDPIEIELAMNTTELLQEFAKSKGGFASLDQTVEKSKSTFSDYVKEKLKLSGIISENAKLTQEESKQLQQYMKVIEILQGKLDDISKLDLDANFASEAELEALGAQLSGVTDEFEELAIILDFMEARFSNMSPDAKGYEELAKALELANMALGKGNFSEFDDALDENQEKIQSLRTEYNELVKELARLKLEGKDNEVAFYEMAQRAAEIKKALKDTNQEITFAGAEQFEPIIYGLESVATGFELARASGRGLGLQQEALDKTLGKVHSSIGLLTAMQQVLTKVRNSDNVMTKSQIALQKAYTFVVGSSTGALKAFRIALAATGIGLIVLAIGELVAHWDDVKKFFGGASELATQYKEKVADMASSNIAKYRSLSAEYNALGNNLKDKQKFIEDNQEAFQELGVKIKDVNDADIALRDATPAVEEVLKLRAEAAAAAAVAMEQYEKAIRLGLEKESREVDLANGNFFDILVVNWKNGVDAFYGEQLDYEKELANKNGDALTKLKLEKENEANDILKKGGVKTYDENEEKRIKEAQREAERARKKAAADAERAHKEQLRRDEEAFKNKISMLNKIADIERSLQKSVMQDHEKGLADIEDKYKAIWQEIKNKNIQLPPEAVKQLQKNEATEKAIFSYKDAEKQLQERLDTEKQMYEALEAYKAQVGEEEANKRFNKELQEFADFGEVLKAEIARLNQEISASPDHPTSELKNQTIDALKKQLANYEAALADIKRNQFADAIQSTITHQERLLQIENDYLARKAEINTLGDEALKQQKLQALEDQKADAIDVANQEAFEKSEVFQRLSETLIGYSKKELQIHIQTLKEFLATANGLTDKQREDLERQLANAESLLADTDYQTRLNEKLKEKQTILDAIAVEIEKGNKNVKELQRSLELVNAELDELDEMKGKGLADFANTAGELGSAFSQLGSAVSAFDEGLGDTISTMGEMMSIAGDLADALASGNPVTMIAGGIKAIAGIFSMGARARESERQAREEIARYEKEMFEAQIAYNAQLRERILNEVRINDLYKSRVENIREELAAMEEQKASVLRDMDSVWERLLRAQTVVGMETERYGGFLGIGRKTRAVEIQQSIAELLGLGNYESYNAGFFTIDIFIPDENIEMTDELLDRLEALNAENPLTGDAADAFRLLQQLRDEYGSIEEAQRQLQIAMKDAITGTTAQTLADSIREGILSGKKSFADFADDIEVFLRNAIIAGMSTTIIEPQIQALQDALYEMMGDGILSEDERQTFQEMYLAIAEQANEYMDMINQAGIDITGSSTTNSLQGAIKGMSEQQADLLAGQFGGLRLAQLETNAIAIQFGSAQLEQMSRMARIQIDIERNTRRTAENTDVLSDVNERLIEIRDGITSGNNAQRNGGY